MFQHSARISGIIDRIFVKILPHMHLKVLNEFRKSSGSDVSNSVSGLRIDPDRAP